MVRRVAGYLWLVVLLGAGPAAAQNLLVNPNLDENLDGWAFEAFTTGFVDSEGLPPGAAGWRSDVPELSGPEATTILSQCVDGIEPGRTYAFSGFFNLVEAQTEALDDPVGTFNVFIFWFTGPGCTSSIAGVDVGSPVGFPPDTWHQSSGSAIAPAGVTSAVFAAIGGIAPIGPGPLTGPTSNVPADYLALADTFFFGPEQQVPTLPFAVALLLALLLTAAVARTLRRTPA